MKKYTILVFVLFFVACENDPIFRKPPNRINDRSLIEIHTDTINGMIYRIFEGSGSPYVVNLTKDSLEIEFYKKSLKSK